MTQFIFVKNDLTEMTDWDYQLHSYYRIPVSILDIDGVNPNTWFIDEYDASQGGRKLIHKYIGYVDDNHLFMNINFEIKSWIDEDSFIIDGKNLEPVDNKRISLFREILDTLNDVGEIPEGNAIYGELEKLESTDPKFWGKPRNRP